jgi:polysaccharide biosynthesis transport protein
MSQTDRRPGSTPARTSDVVARPVPSSPTGPDGPIVGDHITGRRRPSIRLAWRALRRHWWQAILLWAAGSAGLMALAHERVRPTFEASSAIRVDPGDRGSSREGGGGDFEVFKETQARRVTNPNVIASALSAHPELLGLPRLVRAGDPEAEVRKAVVVTVVPGTNLIQVRASSESADEAAEIVNAVTDAYLNVAPDPVVEEERAYRCRRLREVKEERTAAIRQKREAVAGLVDKIGSVDTDRARDRNSVTIETYRVLTQQLLRHDLELVDEQARLEQLRNQSRVPASGDPPGPDGEVVAAFYARPEVAEVQSRLARARDRLTQAGRISRDSGDQSWVDARKRVDELQSQIDALWGKMRPSLLQAGRAAADRAATLREAERHASEDRVNGLKARLAQLNERLEKLNARTRSAGADELTLEFARQDLGRAESVLESVTRALDQVEFQAREPVARFRQEYRARAPSTPGVDHRATVMAAAPVGMFLLVLGLFTLVELRAGRVADPEDVPRRLCLSVLGVVPPLPGPRPTSGYRSRREELRSRRDLDQFIQSLDHLRVAICAGKDLQGRPRRSILITSACGGEGKTTLAAQLAERSVNAGLLTLLIDADLRNPTLSRMFDLSAGRGLIDVLRGEAMAEEAIAVIGGAGGFHFLPAGSERVDPARLLHDGRLPRLLARARESFDLVIVDAPPVLPVPDALTIGRWVDGAVLAVRYDSSRYPLVEQANRRLAAVGVPVIGAVINGVRGGVGSYHGSYYPSYGPTVDDPTL